jgi:hypothetical protein
MGQNLCDYSAILRNEPIAAPDDPGGGARNAAEGAPGSEAHAPGARWTSQLDPSHPPLVAGHGADVQPSPQTETSAAPNEPARIDQAERTAIIAVETAEDATESDDGPVGASVCLSRGTDPDFAERCDEPPYCTRATTEPTTTVTPCEHATCDDDTILRNKAIATPNGSPIRRNDNPAGLAGSIASGGKEELAQDDVGSGVNDVNEPPDANDGNPQGDGPPVPRATVPPWAARRLAELLVPMDPAALALLSDAERRARSWAQFHAKRKVQSGS